MKCIPPFDSAVNLPWVATLTTPTLCQAEKKANEDGYYKPNDRLLQRLYDHFKSTGKLKALEAGFAAAEA